MTKSIISACSLSQRPSTEIDWLMIGVSIKIRKGGSSPPGNVVNGSKDQYPPITIHQASDYIPPTQTDQSEQAGAEEDGRAGEGGGSVADIINENSRIVFY